MTDDEYNGALAQGFWLGLKIAAPDATLEDHLGQLQKVANGDTTLYDSPNDILARRPDLRGVSNDVHETIGEQFRNDRQLARRILAAIADALGD
jgi:hypothetical protein